MLGQQAARGGERVLCLDFGGTKLAAGVVDLSDNAGPQQISAARAETPGNAEASFAAMMALAKGLAGVDTVGRIGVSFGGPVQANRIVRSMHVPGWEGFPLAARLAGVFGPLPVRIANDANAIALAEHKFGAGQAYSAMLYITVSTGVGGGLILDGLLHEGANGLAGEIGHMKISPSGPLCSCGRRGCVESLAAGPAILARARDVLPGARSAADVAAAAATNNDARRILMGAAWALGVGISNVLNLLDLQAVILGGGVTQAGDLWWTTLYETLQEETLPGRQVAVLPSGLGDEPGLLGAAALAAE